jgi:signal transduction histidine kinase
VKGLRNLGERAAAMGGSLDVESVPGEGTMVRLRLPL